MKNLTDLRASGLLLAISSLPSKHGIGTLGEEAFHFIDFLHASGQTFWQMLPIGPTGYGDSPYQSSSSYAGNPYFIDLDLLCADGLLSVQEVEETPFCTDPSYVDYGLLYKHRRPLLRKAFLRALERGDETDLLAFMRKEESWLPDFALYTAIKKQNGEKPWIKWPASLKNRDNEAIRQAKEQLREEILFEVFLQKQFFTQWEAMKRYANRKGVYLMGDLPIYVSEDSAEVWANPHLFHMDKNRIPTMVGGVPPDDFSDDGQLWGNPLYDWDVHKKEQYAWWIDRLKNVYRFTDMLRIDHFRGFADYWGVPYGAKTAASGQWYKGPGADFFRAVNEQMPGAQIIAEDLGYMTPEVVKIRKDAGYPGMQILEFAFDPSMNAEHLPHKHERDNVVYIGTHDNQTLKDWMQTQEQAVTDYATRYFHLDKKEGIQWGFIRGAMSSVANLAIFQVQDLLYLGKEARMNQPNTVSGNWTWRMHKEALTDTLAKKLKERTQWFGRDTR